MIPGKLMTPEESNIYRHCVIRENSTPAGVECLT